MGVIQWDQSKNNGTTNSSLFDPTEIIWIKKDGQILLVPICAIKIMKKNITC